MVICFDGKALEFSKNRGMGNYTINLLKTFISEFPDNDYILLSWSDKEEDYNIDKQANISYVRLFEFSDCTLSDDKLKIGIINFLNHYKVDVFIDTAPMSTSVVYDKLWFTNTFLIGIVYDFIPYIFADEMLTNKNARQMYLRHLVNQRNYDFLISISDNTRIDAINILELDEKQIVNCYMDGNRFEKITDHFSSDTIEKFGIKKPYFLSAVWFEYHKNLERILEAYGEAYAEDSNIPSLVLTGKIQEKYKKLIRSKVEKFDYKDKLFFVGYVSDDELNDLFFDAEWLIFPSLYEGFGMSILEAWRKGVPVITSNNSSLGEIATNAAVLVDPYSVHSIKEALLRTSRMPQSERCLYIEKGKKRANDFSWEKTVEKMINVINANVQYKFDLNRYLSRYIDSLNILDNLDRRLSEKVNKKIWKGIIAQSSNIVIFGCGICGKRLYDNVPNEYREYIKCFCDNGQFDEYMGVRVLKPNEVVNQYEDAVYIIAMKNNKKDVFEQLMLLGIELKQIFDSEYINLS